MLEKPAIPDEKILACLRGAFGLRAAELEFLPLGADVHTAVYRVSAKGGVYFLKLRSGAFDEAAVALPRYLADLGLRQVIAPLPTSAGRLWAELDAYRAVLSPYVAGRNAYEVKLTEQQWGEFGTALRQLHAAHVPLQITRGLPVEDYAPRWREQVHGWLERIDRTRFADPAAAQTADLLRRERAEILALIRRTEQLADGLRARPLPRVVCHADLHAGNLLIGEDGALFLIDWDTLIQAPVERDLMYVGGGLLGRWYSPAEEEALFYRAYGPVHPDGAALAYYRYERIIADIAAYCEQLLASDAGGDDRAQSFLYLASNFLPGNTIEIARRGDVG